MGRCFSPNNNDSIGNMRLETSEESKTYGIRNWLLLNNQFKYRYCYFCVRYLDQRTSRRKKGILCHLNG